jgi:hypothetical protein
MRSASQKAQSTYGVGATVGVAVGVVGGAGVVVGVVDGTELVMSNMESHMLKSTDINDYGQLVIILGAFEMGERKKV